MHTTPGTHEPQFQFGEVIRELLEVLEPHPHEDIEYMEYLYSGNAFFDDVHGKWLDKSRAIEARRLELKFFRKMGVYTKVPRTDADGNDIITTRWIDTDKGDDDNPQLQVKIGWARNRNGRTTRVVCRNSSLGEFAVHHQQMRQPSKIWQSLLHPQLRHQASLLLCQGNQTGIHC